jgi:outer membrane protein
MSTKSLWRVAAVLVLTGILGVRVSNAAPLTADDAVRVALKQSTQVVNANANVLNAKSGVLSSYGTLMPSLQFGVGYNYTGVNGPFGTQVINGQPVGLPVQRDSRTNSSSMTLNVPNIGLLDWSAWAGLSSSKANARAANLQVNATHADVALATRRQFYVVVQSIKLAEVASGALKRARDDERRVNAMFQVGSVSKSDLLKAQVATAQSELDSITAQNDIVTQRVALATQMGVAESQLGDVDTMLTVAPVAYDEAQILGEAQKSRPDLIAADASVQSAKAATGAAKVSRLPYVTAGGFVSFSPRSHTTFVGVSDKITNGRDLNYQMQLGINWDVFNLSQVDARIASSRANELRAQATYDQLRRNLASEVHQALLNYNQSLAGNNVAQRGLESATENLKLTQEKYNVGSATILELIDAQVNLQTAQSNVVKALAAIRVAEAQVNRVRGHGE